MLFVANDGTTGEEIWTTDGTEAGTQLLQDINPGPLGSMQFAFTGLYGGVPMNGKLYFTAYKEGVGSELWETDGTQANTKLFKEILPGPDAGIPYLMPNYKYDLTASSWNPAHQGSVFYFLFGLPAEAGVELWKSDGTDAGTVKVKTIRDDDNDFGNASYVYTPAGLYFSVDNGLDGDELWKSNGTEAGTTMLLDLNPGEDGSEIRFLPFTCSMAYLRLCR
jgi:ELWxxDGT repeat protein